MALGNEGEKPLKEQNEELRLATIEFAASQYVNGCGQDKVTKRRALELAETLGTPEEVRRAIDKISPHLIKVQDFAKSLGMDP